MIGKKSDVNKYEKTGLIHFPGRVSDEKAASLFSEARALLFPGIEDLGLVPIEAQAAGCPVIAYKDGGALDTVIDNKTGIFFNEQTAASLIDAMDRFEAALENGSFLDRNVFTEHVRQFSPEAFKERINKTVVEKKRV